MNDRRLRTAQLVIRMLPELRQAIEDDASLNEMPASSIARRILARHYEEKHK